jgi:hypothetical protein
VRGQAAVPWSFAEMRLLCIQNGLLQQHCTNQGRRRLVACSVAFRVLGAENDHVSCRLPARRCWIRHDAARCRKGLRGSESMREGGGRPHCKAAWCRRPRSESHPHCGRSAFRGEQTRLGLGRSWRGQSSRAAEQQNSRTAQQAPSSTQTIAQRNNEEGCRTKI